VETQKDLIEVVRITRTPNEGRVTDLLVRSYKTSFSWFEVYERVDLLLKQRWELGEAL